MKKLIILSFTFLFILACKSDDDVDNTNETPVLLTKFIKNDFTYNLKYDGNKLVEVTSNHNSYKKSYTYNGNLITKITEFEDYNSDGTVNETANLVYENDRLVLVTVNGITSTSDIPYTRTFKYSYPNQTTINCTKTYNYTFAVAKDELTYTISNDNVVQVKDKYFTDNIFLGEITVSNSYDDKKEPYANILGFDKIKLYNYETDKYLRGSKNNLLKVMQTNVSEINGTSKYRVEYFNSYNSNNYPIHIIEKYFYSDNEPAINDVTSYSYNQ
ncbi:hypothetical protein PQ459_11445 [Chryseobacterium sp. KACC 21268]|nr:hypothetical protein PQ459_11445 [Chryseobacterium sp. KACC 21268]